MPTLKRDDVAAGDVRATAELRRARAPDRVALMGTVLAPSATHVFAVLPLSNAV
jgi:hypothetical protein